MEPQQPSVTPVPGGASAATEVLFQAQKLADRLRDEAQADAARIRDDATGAIKERDDAIAELDFAKHRLTEARADRLRLKRELKQAGKATAATAMPGAPAPDTGNAALRQEIVKIAERLMSLPPNREAAE